MVTTPGLARIHPRPSQFMQVYFREVPTIVREDAVYRPMGHQRLAPLMPLASLIVGGSLAHALTIDRARCGAQLWH